MDSSGSLHYFETIRLVQDLGLELTAEQVGAVAETADMSQDGNVSLSEFLKVGTTVGPTEGRPSSCDLDSPFFLS